MNLGAVCAHGVDVAKKSFLSSGKINNVPVRIIEVDVHDEANTSVSEFRHLVDVEKVQAILTLRSRTALPINPLTEREA